MTAAWLTAGEVSAQAPDPAAAQALFDEAKQLVAAGQVAAACPKFLASFNLDPKPGAAVNLADCYEKNGQTASAWARYLEAASLAQRAGQADREQYAREHAAALEPKLSRLTIAAPKAQPGLEVLRDGAAIDAAMWGSAVPVDPGKHVVEARAPEKKPWSTTVEVAADGAKVQVEVPALEDASKAPASTETPAAPTAPKAPASTETPAAPTAPKPEGETPQPPPVREAPATGIGMQRKLGIVLGSAAVAGLVVGSAFGLAASSSWEKAQQNGHCDAPTNGATKCDQTGKQLVEDAQSDAAWSTGMFVAGGVLLAAGVVLFVTAPSPKAAPAAALWIGPRVGPGGAGLSAQGAF